MATTPATTGGLPAKASTFGPSALLTPANGITLARLLATPAIIVMVAVGGAGWTPFAVAFAIGVTDGLDGWLARRQGTTRSGAFLDPLADKVAVVGVLGAIAARGLIPWLPVVLIGARELSMSVYRVVMGRRGVSIPARNSAKLKTLVQGIAILLCLSPPLTTQHTVLDVAVWVAVAMTLVTGVQYLVDGRVAARAREDGAARAGEDGAARAGEDGAARAGEDGAARAGEDGAARARGASAQ